METPFPAGTSTRWELATLFDYITTLLAPVVLLKAASLKISTSGVSALSPLWVLRSPNRDLPPLPLPPTLGVGSRVLYWDQCRELKSCVWVWAPLPPLVPAVVASNSDPGQDPSWHSQAPGTFGGWPALGSCSLCQFYESGNVSKRCGDCWVGSTKKTVVLKYFGHHHPASWGHSRLK
jgi:hypothetical protein